MKEPVTVFERKGGEKGPPFFRPRVGRQLVQSADGSLLLVFCVGKEIRAMHSADGGENWIFIQNDKGRNLTLPARNGVSLWMDKDDRLLLIYGTGRKVYHKTLVRTEGEWREGESLLIDTFPEVKNPSLCRDDSGILWSAYTLCKEQGISAVRVRQGRKNSFHITYGFPSTFNLLNPGEAPALFYSGASNNDSLLIYWTLFDGEKWSFPIPLGEARRSPGMFDAARDRKENTHLVWKTGGGEERIFHKVCDASGKWGEATVLTTEPAGKPVVTTDGERILCYWVEEDRARGESCISCRIWRNNEWGERVEKRRFEQGVHVSDLKIPFRLRGTRESVPMIWVQSDSKRDSSILFFPLSTE